MEQPSGTLKTVRLCVIDHTLNFATIIMDTTHNLVCTFLQVGDAQQVSRLSIGPWYQTHASTWSWDGGKQARLVVGISGCFTLSRSFERKSLLSTATSLHRLGLSSTCLLELLVANLHLWGNALHKWVQSRFQSLFFAGSASCAKYFVCCTFSPSSWCGHLPPQRELKLQKACTFKDLSLRIWVWGPLKKCSLPRTQNSRKLPCRFGLMPLETRHVQGGVMCFFCNGALPLHYFILLHHTDPLTCAGIAGMGVERMCRSHVGTAGPDCDGICQRNQDMVRGQEVESYWCQLSSTFWQLCWYSMCIETQRWSMFVPNVDTRNSHHVILWRTLLTQSEWVNVQLQRWMCVYNIVEQLSKCEVHLPDVYMAFLFMP